MRRSATLLAALSTSAVSHAAELSVRGPAACPDVSELAFRVERAIGTALRESGPLRFEVLFNAAPEPEGGYTAHLRVGRSGAAESTERVLQAHDCGRLGDAVGVAIALAIGAQEPTSAEAAGAAAATGTTRTNSLSMSPSVSGIEDTALRDRAREDTALDDTPRGNTPHDDIPRGNTPRDNTAARLRAGAASTSDASSSSWLPVAQAFVLADGGSLASPGLGLGLGAELRGARVSLRAQGALLPERRVSIEGGGGAPGAELSLLLGSLSGCVSPFGSLRATLATFVCAGWELGRLSGEGAGVEAPLEGAQLWTAPRLDAGLSGAFAASALRLALQLSIAAPLERDDFCLRELGCVYRPPGAVGRLALGLELGFE